MASRIPPLVLVRYQKLLASTPCEKVSKRLKHLRHVLLRQDRVTADKNRVIANPTGNGKFPYYFFLLIAKPGLVRQTPCKKCTCLNPPRLQKFRKVAARKPGSPLNNKSVAIKTMKRIFTNFGKAQPCIIPREPILI